MKVPVYKEKLARTKTSGGGVFLQAQANPNAWGAMGKALSSIGDDAHKFGMEKFKIQATSDTNETIPLFTAAIATIGEKHKNSSNPLVSEKKVKKEMMDAYKLYSSGALKNTDGNSFLSSNLSKRLFSTKASQLVTAGILSWKKANNAHIVQLNKLNESKILSDNDKIASNTLLDIDVRFKGLNANHAASIYDKNKEQSFSNYIGMPGKFSELAANGTFKYKEHVTKQKKSLENIVTGISLNLIKSKTHSSMSVTQVLVNGDIKELKKVDPILATVWEKLLPEDKADFIKKVRALENNKKKDAEDAKKEFEENANAKNEKIEKEIINTDFSNPTAKKEALLKYNKLLKNKYFDKASDRNIIENFFEEEDENVTKKTDNKTFRMLDLLDDENKLTKALINNSYSKLSTQDYKSFLNRLKQEKSDAREYVIKTVINGSFFIDEINSDDESEEEFDRMRMASKNEFMKWLENNGTEPYSTIVAKGEEIMKQPKITIAAMYKASFDDQVMKFKAVSNLKKGFEKSYPDGKYTLVNIMRHLVVLGLNKAQPKSFAKRFKNFLGLPGANEWNN